MLLWRARHFYRSALPRATLQQVPRGSKGPGYYFAYTVDRFAAGTLRAGAGHRQTAPARAERNHDPQSALRSRRVCILAGADGSRIHFELWYEHGLQWRKAACSRGSNSL